MSIAETLRVAQWTPARAKIARPSKHLIAAAAISILAAAAAYYGYEWWTVGRFNESTDDAYVGGEVTVAAPQVAGFITRVAVTDNQHVHAGELLVKLDDREYRAALAKADAMVAAAKATLANFDATRDLQQALIAQARAEILSANAEVVRSAEDKGRYARLEASNATSLQAVQRADASYTESIGARAKAEAALAAAERELAVIAAKKQEAQAQLAQALANRRLARLNLGYTEIRSPIDGTIGNRDARAGAYASIGTQLLSIVPAHGLWIDANFKESQLADLHRGETVTIEADVLPGEVFRGHVASLAPATGAQFSVLPPENATGNFTKIVQRVPVRIVLDGDASELGKLRPGLSTTVTVDTRREDRS